MKHFIRATNIKVIDVLINVMFFIVGLYAIGFIAGVIAGLFSKIVSL
ncbi:MAG: hypothetical protein WAZ98_14400 [Cyclobacteriaceae bacterium]